MNPYKNKTAIVTGGLGLIGSFVCDTLIERGFRVVVIDNESKGGWTYCSHLAGHVEHRMGDLEDITFAMDALTGGDLVFHLASRTCGVGFSSNNHFELFQQNNRVTFNVLSAVAASRPAHLLVTSSSCVYSDDAATPLDDKIPWTGEPEAVNYGYGWAKRILEEMASGVCSKAGVRLTIARPVNVYGERYHWIGDASQALPMLTRRIMEGENPLVIWGSGNQRRSYVHASDCARIMVELVLKQWVGGPVNIGAEDAVSLVEAASIIARAAGKEIDYDFDRSKPEGRLIKAACSKRLCGILGVAPESLWQVPPDVGLPRMAAWHHLTFNS